jgi:hypothetical protein
MISHSRNAMLYIFKRKIQIHIPPYNTNFGKFKSANFDGKNLVITLENGTAPYGRRTAQGQDFHGELSELGLAGVEGLREQSFQSDGNGK